ncbi:MAG: hypothetical protein ACT4TC_17235 [Myxococcaceae bacterium]
MTSFGRILLCVIALSSSAAFASFSAFSIAERASFKGALLDEAPPLHRAATLAPGLRLAQADISQLPVGSMTREQLRAEYSALDAARPGLGGKIAMLAVGGVLAIVGLYPFFFGLVTLSASGVSGTSAATVNIVGAILLGVGVVLIVTGVILAIVGGIRLVAAIRERSRYGARMDEVQRQIDTLDAGGGAAPPPAPTNVFFPVQPRTIIARF